MNKYLELLNEISDFKLTIEDIHNLSSEQKIAYDLFLKKQSFLILGQGGCGKSYFIKFLKDVCNEMIFFTATTGVSAYNISGMTIHSFIGIGPYDKNIKYTVNKIRKKKHIVERLLSVDILIIDEISMMSALLFELIDGVCKYIRKDNRLFGGIQLILCGDFLQNEPVFLENDEDKRLLIDSKLYLKHFNKKLNNIIQFKENFRQNDNIYLNLLSRLRCNTLLKSDIDLLKNKCNNYNTDIKKLKKNENPIFLVPSNRLASIINEQNLNNLNSQNYTYTCNIIENGTNKEFLSDMKKDIEKQFQQKGLLSVNLKENARVMLVRNLETESGLVNGSTGIVTGFDNGFPIIKFDESGILRKITNINWDFIINDNKIIIEQIPLILAYSITIHKAQSITLTKAVMDLKNCFCNHLVYSALSRIKSLDGLFLKSFDETKIKVNPNILSYLNTLT